VWERLALLAWLALDLVIVGQVVAWGAQGQLPVVQRHFGVILLAAMLITYVGQWTYMQSTEDIDGTRMAWLGNLVMSILFLLTALTRHPRVGLSYPAAWAKLLGSAFFAAAMIFARTIGTDSKQLSVQSRARVKPILFFLFATVLLFDSLYVYALRQL
jgi:hypothetical protein